MAVWQVPGAGLVLAVADGLGGGPSGAAASALAIQALQMSLSRTEEDSLRVRIIDAFEEANRGIQALGVGAGTTMVVGHIEENVLRTYHVGDSAGIVVGQRGKVKLQTISHSPVGYGVAAGLIDPDEALQHDDRHFLSNYLGANDMHIQVGSRLVLDPFDTVLLASDGLLDNFLIGEIVDAIRTGSLPKVSSELAKTCMDRMTSMNSDELSKPDDMTFALFRLGNRG